MSAGVDYSVTVSDAGASSAGRAAGNSGAGAATSISSVRSISFSFANATILEIIVHESDMGAVIGRNGKMASAIRTLVQAHAYILGLKKVKINI